jgi:O-antigen/teichoic acid export membrane protein
VSRGRDLAKNTAIIAAGRLLPAGLALVTLPIYTRFLAPSEYGSFDVMMTYVGLLIPIVTVNLDMAAFRFLIDARDDPEQQQRILTTVTLTVTATGLAAVALFALVNLWASVPAAPLLAAQGAVTILLGVALQTARGLGRTALYAGTGLLNSLVTVAATIPLVTLAHAGIAGLLGGSLAGNVTALLFVTLRLRLDRLVRPRAFQRTLLRELAGYSGPLVPNGICWWIVNLSNRTVIILALGAAATGVFGIGTRLTSPLPLIIGVINLSWSEAAALAIDSEDRSRFFSRVFDSGLRVLGSAGLGLLMAIALLFDLLVGPDYAGAYGLVPLLVVASLANGLTTLYGAVYTAAKKTPTVLRTTLVGAAVNVAVAVSLVWFIGLYAACLGTALAFAVMSVQRHRGLRGFAPIRYDRRLVAQFAVGALIVTACYYARTPLWLVVGTVTAAAAAAWFLWPVARPLLRERLGERRRHDRPGT